VFIMFSKMTHHVKDLITRMSRSQVYDVVETIEVYLGYILILRTRLLQRRIASRPL
jgi:hypothetical protein